MRTFYFCLALLALLLPATAEAQIGAPTHPTDPSAILLGSFTSTVLYSTGHGGSNNLDTLALGATSKDRDVGGHSNICVWRIAGGSVEYVIESDSISLIGIWDAGDSISAVDFFDNLSRAVVAQGAALGYTPCPGMGSSLVHVLSPSCVTRTGTGIAAKFIACGPNTFCERILEISCANGPAQPTITLRPSLPHPPICPGPGCISTCR